MIRKLLAMIRNEFLVEFAYPLSLLFFLVLPLLFTAAVGLGLGGMMDGGNDEPPDIRARLYVVSADDGPLVENLFESLSTSNLLPQRVETLPEDVFGLEVPADFSARLLAGEAVTVTLHTLPTTSRSQAVEQYVQAAISRLGGAALVAEMGATQARESGLAATNAEARAFFDGVFEDTLAASQQPNTVPELRWAGDAAVETPRDLPTSAEQASAGQVVTWVQITLLGAAEVIVNERRGGTLRRLLVMPAHRATVLGGKLLARLTLGAVQMTLLFAGGAWLFGVNWGQDALALAAVSLAFALATVGLGMLVATVVRTAEQASSVVVGLAMGLAALGGAWYPLEITPPLYRQIVQILPSTWAMRAYTDLLVRGAGLRDVLPAIGALLLFATAFTALGVWRFNRYE